MSDRRSYPGIPVRNWWDLRRRFQQAVPRQVDSDYLQSVLGDKAFNALDLGFIHEGFSA